MFTNLNFVDVPTLQFELRSANRIELDQTGQVINSSTNRNNQHPPDVYSSQPPLQVIRQSKNFPRQQLMTPSQISTFKNHDGKSQSYDEISIFSLRPPELLDVFNNPVDYFRLCCIGENKIKHEDIEKILNCDIGKCSWIDCLGREVNMNEMFRRS